MTMRFVRVSDLSGEVIPEGQGVRLRLMYEQGWPDMKADLSVEEADRIAEQVKAKEVPRRSKAKT